jgi:hypothetical protein
MNKRFKPQYLPHSDNAHALVEALARALGVSRQSIYRIKNEMMA